MPDYTRSTLAVVVSTPVSDRAPGSDLPSRPSSADASPRQAHFILATLLVILPAAYAFYSILSRILSPAPSRKGTTLYSTSQSSNTTNPVASLDAKQSAIQVTPFASSQGTWDVGDLSAEGAGVVNSTEIGSAGPRRASGAHAASDSTEAHGTQDNILPSIIYTRPAATCLRATPSLDCPGCEHCLVPAPTAEPAAPRGVAPNLVQNERLSLSPPIGAHNTIIKSLYDHPHPETIERGQDGASPPLPAFSSRASWQDPVVKTPLSAWNATTFFILLVAVGGDWLKYPKTDHDFLLGAFQSDAVHLVSLLDDEATHESVRCALRQLYHEAQRCDGPARVLVYLTGQGEESGNMRLSGATVLTPRDFEGWLAELRAESAHPQPAFGITFDICRPSTFIAPSYDPKLPIVWSCSAGQWSFALGFGPDLPSSCFLISLFLAAYDSLFELTGFENEFKLRLDQQGALLQFIHRRKHEGKTCAQCYTNHLCPPPDPQVPEWGEAGRDTLLALGELIKSEFPGVARRVHDAVVKKMAIWKFPDPELQGPAKLECGARSVGLSTRHHRGSTGAILQLAAPNPALNS